MNDRIKQLADQSWNKFKLFDVEIGTPYEFAEKFAEMIVQECADTVLGFRNQFGDSAHAEIREHFGVK